MIRSGQLLKGCLIVTAGLLSACYDSAQQNLPDTGVPQFVGSDTCGSCHETQFENWLGSHHQLAMQIATGQTVLGDFSDATFEYFGTTSRFYSRKGEYYVHTVDGVGQEREFRIAYTFGVEPLQQYLVEFPGGRLQTLAFSWDSRPLSEGGQRWFHIYGNEDIAPGDPLHWTGREQNWNYMCAECHSTNLRMAYDVESTSFDTSYSEISVGCEACHGPGSRHVDVATRGSMNSYHGLVVELDDRGSATWIMNAETGIAGRSRPMTQSQLQPEACGRCHARRGVITDEYVYGEPLADSHLPSLLEDELYFSDGQIQDEVYVYGSFLQSRMYRSGVTCSDCHNPHSAQLHTGDEPNDVCAQCHLPATFATREHAGHGADEAGCVDCHMATRTYMVVDDRRDHSFRIPRPDLSATVGTPNACETCHDDRDATWAAAAIHGWRGADARLQTHYATAIAAGRKGFANAELIDVARNPDLPAIVRATALSLLAAPLGGEDLRVVQAALDDTDPLVRIAALRQLRFLPGEFRMSTSAAARLSDPVRGVRMQAVLAFAGLADLLPAGEARAFGVAAAEYREVYELIANRPEANAILGDFEAANGSVQAAIGRYEQALRIEPSLVIARVNLADMYRVAGDETRGEAVLRDGLAIDPGAAALQHALGLLLARTGRADDAIAELRRAVAAAPEYPRYAYVLGVALNSLGRHDEAIGVLREARNSFATDFDIAWGLATMLRDRDDTDAALEIAEELVRRHPGNSSVRGLRDSLQGSQ